MAYNDLEQTSGSEVILSNMEHEGVSKKNKDFDYVDDWLNVTVESEIWRGKILREEKPIPGDMEYEYNVADIDFLGSFVNKKKQCHERKGPPKSSKIKTSPSTPRNKSPNPRPTSAATASSYLSTNRILRTNTPRIKPKNPKKCSMRIAELAVPTKRQCIETWRNKSDILPEFMVERLKQHVMDQRPIVKIPDAIYCFQRRRPESSKNCSLRCPQTKNENNYDILKPCRQMETRTLCIVFAHKIAKLLLKPLNLTLNSDLQILSKIVASDIAKLLSKSKCQCIFDKNRKYKSIHTDVSNKITVWIAGILEDLSLKLLEEDLRVKRENELNAKNSEQFITVMEIILQQEQKMQFSDLEEEEGPVLDFIDDVVDNVLNICEPPPVFESESDTSDYSKEGVMEEESEQPLTPIESTDNKMSKLEEIFNTKDVTQDVIEKFDALKDAVENLTDTEHFKKEIYYIIDNIIKVSGEDISRDSGEDINKESGQDSNKESGQDMNKESGQDINKESGEDINKESGQDINKVSGEDINKESGEDNNKEFGEDISNGSGDEIENENNVQISQQAKIEQDINDMNTGETDDDSQNLVQNHKAIDNDQQNYTNVSEGFEILPEDDDKNSKKVMFSVTDLVNINKTDEQTKTSITDKPKNDENEQTQNDKSNIIFAEPNAHLLSDADESWPSNLSEGSMIKISDSASKSITSLGKINENDEKQISPPEDEDNIANQRKKADRKLRNKNIMDKLNSMLPTEKYDAESQVNKPVTKTSKETTTTEPKNGVTQVDSNTLVEQDISKTITVPKTSDDKIVDESSKQEKLQVDSRDRDLIRRGSTTGRTEDDKIPSHKTQSQIDYGWKVHLKTAPSWVTSCGQGRGEPSEDSIPIQIRPTRVTESEMRKWCRDLEKAYINLEMWSHWISNTCKETVFLLKQKGLTCPRVAKKGATNWIRLKRNIHKDAILWTKLYQRTENNFKSLKRKYNNIEFSSNEPTKSNVNKAIFETLCEFENLSVELHKMIVAAEYCALCTCNKTR